MTAVGVQWLSDVTQHASTRHAATPLNFRADITLNLATVLTKGFRSFPFSKVWTEGMHLINN